MKPMIVAELSANHLGSYRRALALVDVAAASGADAIKLQTYTPEQMVAAGKVLTRGHWAGQRALELYRQAHTPRGWHRDLFARAKELGMVAFSSVFHPDDVDFLEELDCPLYKIASFEITDKALIRYAAATRKPLIISTGMATYAEVLSAHNHAQSASDGFCEVTMLKCTSAYPAQIADANLATMAEFKRKYGHAGLSDHTAGHVVACAATALGAEVIEKHLTLSRADGGPDAAFSMEPHEFAEMVQRVRATATAVGEVRYGPTADELPQAALRRPSGGMRGDATTIRFPHPELSPEEQAVAQGLNGGKL